MAPKAASGGAPVFDVNKLVNSWDQLAPATRNALFGRTMDMQGMEYLMNVLRPMSEAERARNFSNTAHVGMQLGGLSALATALAGAAHVGSIDPVVGAAAPIAGGYALNAVMSIPGLARWMATSIRAGGPRAMPPGVTQQMRSFAAREGIEATANPRGQ